DHLTVNSARGHHLVVLFQFVQELLVLFALLLLRTNHHKIHDDENQGEGNQRHHRAGTADARPVLRVCDIEHTSSYLFILAHTASLGCQSRIQFSAWPLRIVSRHLSMSRW